MKRILSVFACICMLACAWSLSGCGGRPAEPVGTNAPSPGRPIATTKPTVRPSARVGVSASWTGTPRTGMYVPTVPEAWEWVGEDLHSVKNSVGKDIQTRKYHYRDGNTVYTIYVDRDDTVVKVDSALLHTGGAGSRPGARRSLMPSPDVSGYFSAEDFYDYYRDDFSDYEEAEDYYYSHGGW